MPNLAWTYTSLKNALQSWPVDTDTDYVADLDSIIGLGELRLVRDLNLEIFDKDNSAISTAVGNRNVTKPTDNIQLRTVHYVNASSEITYLERRSLEWCKAYAPVVSAQADPLYFAELDKSTIYVVPTPSAIRVMNYHYVARPGDSLNSGAPSASSFLATAVPDALFAACLMEAEHYIKDDDRYGDYKTKYYEEILPVARLELRQSIRAGDLSPPRAMSPPTQ